MMALAPDFLYIDSWGGFAYSELGDDDDAMEEFARVERVAGRPSLFLVLHPVRQGRTDAARQLATRITDAVRAGAAQLPPEFLAIMWSDLGDEERVFEWLEEGVRQRSAVAPMTPFLPRLLEIARSERYRAFAAEHGVPLSPALR